LQKRRRAIPTPIKPILHESCKSLEKAMPKKEIETHCPKSQAGWRKWLEENHETEQSIWLVYYRASTKVASLTWSEAVDEAFCFGWIDSTKKSICNTSARENQKATGPK
jgi:uncharacterized protein YdeI (YjbR/CyaY-like superfamily)